MWFQVHCPPLVGVLPIFRSRYWCAIGRQGVFSLAGWAPRIQPGFHVSGPTQVPSHHPPVSPTGLSPAAVAHSRAFGYLPVNYAWSYNPLGTSPEGLGYSAFARRY